MTTQTTNHVGAFTDELDKTNPVIQDHVRQMAAQYGGQSEAVQAILKYVNRLHISKALTMHSGLPLD